MNEMSDQDLDELLKRHLNTCLDGQLGRATAAFQAHRADRSKTTLWWLGSAVALAAGLAVAWVLISARLAHTPVHIPQKQLALDSQSTATLPPMVQSTTWSGVKDDGLTVIEDQPIRQLRRQVVDEVEWYDAQDRAIVKTRMPRQQVFLIGLRTD